MSSFEQSFTRLYASGWHFPAVIFTEHVAILTNQYNMPIINEWQNTHTFAAFDHTIDCGLAIWHLCYVFPYARPGILMNGTTGDSFPRFRGHSIIPIRDSIGTLISPRLISLIAGSGLRIEYHDSSNASAKPVELLR